ncbi:hypothetical protein G4X40_19215 [Rhodococcus sp. D2-41]|uniref:PASTA domain-containing protein n=1 Tax=Speluncibacter jeojiensis TaxID=2710754 RepID=A0A9X4M0I2_9ACTN|nr:PASTA domain-containing protein [Rhodococcus sp. D2-41]MDG3012274.1 hypothetical protein [Rhodococcus sp. D2-41]MDG3014755.1 PASTA domain-containing protein [Corynebacteriales bacterium D3-21]
MKPFLPYLRVLAGFLAAVFVWVSLKSLVHGEIAGAVVGLLMGAGIAYLAVGQPLRQRRAHQRDEYAALAARADAAYAADLRGDTVVPPPPPASLKPKARKGVVIAAVVAAVLFLFGVVNDLTDGDQQSKPSSGPAATSIAPALPVRASAMPPTTTDAPTTTMAPTTTAESAAVTTAPLPAAAASAAGGDMPDVMCMNLQDAQDLIQQHGVFYSRSRDATGKGCHQVLDRNWVVVQQSPSPGTPIGEGDAVLSVVKKGEPGDCS